MAANTTEIFIEGIDTVIKLDLAKHQDLLERAKLSLFSFREGVAHQVKKKRFYSALIGGEKYNDDSLRDSISMINVDVRHLSDKAKLAEDEISHHTLIVDTLAKQLEDYNATAIRLLQ